MPSFSDFALKFAAITTLKSIPLTPLTPPSKKWAIDDDILYQAERAMDAASKIKVARNETAKAQREHKLYQELEAGFETPVDSVAWTQLETNAHNHELHAQQLITGIMPMDEIRVRLQRRAEYEEQAAQFLQQMPVALSNFRVEHIMTRQQYTEKLDGLVRQMLTLQNRIIRQKLERENYTKYADGDMARVSMTGYTLKFNVQRDIEDMEGDLGRLMNQLHACIIFIENTPEYLNIAFMNAAGREAYATNLARIHKEYASYRLSWIKNQPLLPVNGWEWLASWSWFGSCAVNTPANVYRYMMHVFECNKIDNDLTRFVKMSITNTTVFDYSAYLFERDGGDEVMV